MRLLPTLWLSLCYSGCYLSHQIEEVTVEDAGAGSLDSSAASDFGQLDLGPPPEPEVIEVVGSLSAPRIFPELFILDGQVIVAAGAGLAGDEPVPLDSYSPVTNRVSPTPRWRSGPVGAGYFPQGSAIVFAGGLDYLPTLEPSGSPRTSSGITEGGRIDGLDDLPESVGWPLVAHTRSGSVLVSGISPEGEGLGRNRAIQWLTEDGRWASRDVFGTFPPGRGAATVTHEDSIVCTGGIISTDTASHAQVSILRSDADEGFVRELAERLLVPRSHHVALLHPNGREVVVLGGVNSVGLRERVPYAQAPPSTSVEKRVLDGTSSDWVRLPDLPSARAAAAATYSADGSLVVIGGTRTPLTEGQGETEILVLDPSEERWRTVPTELVPRYAHGLLALPDGDILIAGGLRSPGIPALEVELLRIREE